MAERRTNRIPLLAHSPEGRACSLYGVIVWVCPGSGKKGVLGVLPTALVVVLVEGDMYFFSCQNLFLLQALQK